LPFIRFSELGSWMAFLMLLPLTLRECPPPALCAVVSLLLGIAILKLAFLVCPADPDRAFEDDAVVLVPGLAMADGRALWK
jgi:hypothetical protein